jgi:hypothetical protein
MGSELSAWQQSMLCDLREGCALGIAVKQQYNATESVVDILLTSINETFCRSAIQGVT